MLTTRSHLFDEFIVCGLDTKNIRNKPNEGQNSINKRYHSSVLMRIPFSDGIIDDSIRKLCLPEDVQIEPTMPREVKFHAFVLVKANGTKQYGGSLVFSHKTQSNFIPEFYNKNIDWIYSSKSISLTSSFVLCDSIERILKILHKSNFMGISNRQFSKSLLEKYIFMLLYEVAMPNPKSALLFSLYQESVYIYSPGDESFDFFDIDIQSVLQSLTPTIVLQLLAHLLNECRILVVGSDYSQIVPITETLLILIYPFSWPHTYVPIVPQSMTTLLEAPFPFIMGIRMTNIDDNQLLKYCVFNVDTKSLHCSKTIPSLPFAKALCQELETTLEIENNKRDPSTIFNTTYKRKISSLGDLYYGVRESQCGSHLRAHFYNSLTREIFVNYFVQLLNNFSDYVVENKDYRTIGSRMNSTYVENFEREKFLAKQSKYTQTFLSMFTTTQMFVSFVDCVLAPKCNLRDNFLKIFNKRRETFFSELSDEVKADGMIFLQTCSLIPNLAETLFHRFNKISVKRQKHDSSTDDIVSNDRPIFEYEDLENSAIFSIKRKIGVFKYSCRPRKMEGKRKSIRKMATFDVHRMSSIDNRFMGNAATRLQLLVECSLKSKLFFVESTIQYSHPVIGSNIEREDVNEAMTISSIIDVLQRIWSHRIQSTKKKIKSHLWNHLKFYATLNEVVHGKKQLNDLKTDHVLTWCIMRKKLNPFREYEEKKIDAFGKFLILSELVSFIDLVNPSKWNDNDKVEAFIRLCLEYRVLDQCFSCLLSETDLLRRLYKHDAFLRQDKERESFLLNMEACRFCNYSSFTNYYKELNVRYLIVMKSSSKTLGLNNAKPILKLYGSINKSNTMVFPNDVMSFEIERPNIGEVILLYMDHEHKGRNNRFNVDSITVENLLTKRTYKFHCGHLYSSSSDHDLSGRYVSAVQVGEDEKRNPTLTADILDSNNTGIFKRGINLTQVQNNIWHILEETIQYLSSYEQRPGAFLYLILQENGVANRIHTVLSNKIRQSFGKKKKIWDIFGEYANTAQKARKQVIGDHNSPYSLHEVILAINKRFELCDNITRFYLWLCIAWRTRNLSKWFIILFHYFRSSMSFESNAFVCDSDSATMFCKMMSRLEELAYSPSFQDLDEFCSFARLQV